MTLAHARTNTRYVNTSCIFFAYIRQRDVCAAFEDPTEIWAHRRGCVTTVAQAARGGVLRSSVACWIA